MDKETLSTYRAEVIEKFINIETIINIIICQRYFKKVIRDFYFEVLYDEYFTFGLRRRILEKILKNIDKQYKEKVQDLNRLNTIRNYFAHCNQEYIEGPDKTQKGKVLDPRNIDREVNFKDLYSEFIEKQGSVVDYLMKISVDLGAELEKF